MPEASGCNSLAVLKERRTLYDLQGGLLCEVLLSGVLCQEPRDHECGVPESMTIEKGGPSGALGRGGFAAILAQATPQATALCAGRRPLLRGVPVGSKTSCLW